MSISVSAVPVSVVVVSRDRPDALYRCVLGLSQLQYNPFEIVVVADADGLAALDCFDGKVVREFFLVIIEEVADRLDAVFRVDIGVHRIAVGGEQSCSMRELPSLPQETE